MGFLDRLHDAATGLGSALEAPVGFVKDLLLSPTDDRGMVDGIYHDFVDRTGQLLSGALGSQGFTGSLVGALPAPARGGFNELIKPAENGMDSAYSDLIGRPISTLATATAEAQAGHGGLSGGVVNGDSWARLFQGKTWAEAWNISAHRSPGQSIELAFMTKDITNPAQVAKAQASDFYTAASGATDAVLRFGADPTQLGLGAATEYLQGLHAVDSQAAITAMSRDGTIGRFADKVMAHAGDTPDPNLLAAKLRDEFFPKSYMGAQHATILADAATQGGAPLVEQATRTLLGSTDEIEKLRTQSADIAGKIDRVAQRPEAVSQLSNSGWLMNNTADSIANQEAELNSLYSEQARNERLDRFSQTMQTLPTSSPLNRARTALTSTDWYQNGIMSKPLRVVFQQAPDHLIQYDSPMSDATLFHFMQQSDMPLDDQLAIRGRYLNAATNGARMSITHEAIDRAVQSISDSTAVVSSRQFGQWVSNIPKSALDDESKTGLFDQYQAAQGRDQKLAVLKDISATHDLPLPGMSVNEMNQHLAMAHQLRDQTYELLNSRKFDGVGRSTIAIEDENGIGTHIAFAEKPLLETQLADLDALPDLRQYRQASTAVGKFRAMHPTTDLPAEIAKTYYDVWKPTTLLRVGAPVRIVSDEGLRVAAKVGGLAAAKMMGSGFADVVKDTAAYAAGKVGIDWNKSSRGMEPFIVNGHALQGAYSTAGDGGDIFRVLNKARNVMGHQIAEAEGGIYDNLRQSGDWRSFAPSDPGHGAAWQRDVNLQLGQSKLGRHIIDARLQGLSREETVREGAAWLRATPDGQSVAREVGRTNFPDWAQRVTDQVDAYLPTDTLKRAALTQSAHEQLLHDEFARAPEQFPNGQLPIVHGEILKQDLGTSRITAALKTARDSLYSNMFDKPDSYLIRNPYFDHLYQAETRRQVQLLTGEKEYGFAERMVRRTMGLPEQSAATNFEVTQSDLDHIQFNARNYALGETKNLLHNFSEQSRASQMLRNVVPFYSAWQQVLTRWAGIAAENPAFMRRLDILWRSPEKAGVVTDGKGNLLGEDDTITSPVAGGPWKKGDPAADSARNVTLSIPKWAKDVPLIGSMATDGNKLRFGKDTLNLALHGLPTLGPLGTMPINEIAKQKPELADSLKWALPYGVQQNTLDVLKPTIVKHLSQQAEGDANRSYAYTVMQLFNDRAVDFNRGIRATPPTWAEAEKDAKSFEHVKNLASFVLPFTPQFVSPYQSYIDAYRARLTYDGTLTTAQKQAPDYQPPKEWFLHQYGNEFFPLTESMSKSIDGVPPTIAGYEARQAHKDLIAQYPELGSLIVGAQGAGSFSSAVYDSQFQTHISSGGSTERQVQPYKDFAAAPATDLGWIYFSKAMDMIDALRIQRNLPSLNVKAASDLAAMKKNLVLNLATKYPSWYEAYASTDSTKWDQKINGMTAIVNTPGMTARPELSGLAQYLQGRHAVTEALAQPGTSPKLAAKKNAGLSERWDEYVNALVAQNPAFAATYYRWLQNDPVIVDPLTNLASAGQLSSTGPLTGTA